MPEVTQSLGWQGGLHTARDPALIASDELTAGENFNIRDGAARLDQRYIQAFDQSDDTEYEPHGSGYGKYGTGTLSEQYVIVKNNTLYEVDLSQSALSMPIASNFRMAQGEWFWAQFADYLYGVNELAGMGRKKIAAGNDGHGDFAFVQLPNAPSSAPQASYDGGNIPERATFLGSTNSASAGTVTYDSVGDAVQVTFTSAQAGARTLTITFDTSPDERPNWGYRDILHFQMSLPPGFSHPTLYLAEGSTHTALTYWKKNLIGGNMYDVYYRLQNIGRESRDLVASIRANIEVPTNGGIFKIWAPYAFGVWLSLDLETNVPPETNPTLRELKYESTYVNTDTGFESPPSPVRSIAASAQSVNGEWRIITPAATGQSGINKIRIYRRIEEGGTITRYRLAEVDNTASASHTDKLTVSEVKDLPTYTPSVLPTEGYTAIAYWLSRLVVAADRLIYISRDSDPLAFVPYDGTGYDQFDAARGVTFYADDNQSEDVYGLTGQEALYIITNRSVRAMIGSTPDNWRLMKLPMAEGAVGVRAWCEYLSGVLVLTPSGRLLYIAVGMNQPEEVSSKVRERFGDEGMSEMATSDAVVAVRPSGEIEVRNQAGRYYLLDTDGTWRRGTFTHGTHSALFVSGPPLRWAGDNGLLYEGGNDSYVSDGGTTADNGTPATWWIETKDERMPRSSVTNVYLDTTQSLVEKDGNMVVNYPRVTPICKRTTAEGLKHYTQLPGKRNLKVGVNAVDTSMRFRIDGDKDTVLTSARVKYERQSDAENL